MHRWTAGALEEPACCICGSLQRRRLLQEHFGGHTFGIVECRRCGLSYSCPRPGPEMRRQLHTPMLRNALVEAGLVTDRHRVPADSFGVFAYEQQSDAVENYRRGLALLASGQRPGRLLDVGCGGGRFVEMARQSGWEASGCDPSPHAIAYARDELALDLRQGTIEAIGFASGRFHAVTLWNVIEHLADPCATLREAHRILVAGGRLLVQTPNFALRRMLCRLGIRGDPLRYRHDSFEHLYHFTPHSLRAILRDAGFSDIVLHTVNDNADRRLRARVRRCGARALAALTRRRVNLHTPLLALATKPP